MSGELGKSGDLGKTRDRDRFEEDTDFVPRGKGKLSEDDSFEEDKLDKPKRRLRSEEEYDEGEGSYLSPEVDNLRTGRSPSARTEEIPSATVRSHEGEGLLAPPGTEGDKFVPYQFQSITSDADPKAFDTKTKTRFSFGSRLLRSCC